MVFLHLHLAPGRLWRCRRQVNFGAAKGGEVSPVGDISVNLSRHPGENRGPERPRVPGFRLLSALQRRVNLRRVRRNDEERHSQASDESIKLDGAKTGDSYRSMGFVRMDSTKLLSAP